MDAQAVRMTEPHVSSGPSEPLASYVVDHIDEAVERGWIHPYYQPVVRTVSGKLCGMEALARWEDPLHGLLSPAVFIGALEDARLIHKLDACMVNQVCQHLRDCLDAGFPVVPISFNLSRLDFDSCDVCAVIEEAARKYEIPRSLLNVEITESVFGSDPAFMVTLIERLHAIGYQIWMDDFGSAYSSLNVLKDFEFDELKIDLEFLNRFGERSRTIVASVVDMAKRLGMQTLAEGVETLEHREFLRRIGCEKQQGYLYGKPRPLSAEYYEELERDLGFEHQSERRYYQTIGSVNTLNLSERDFMTDSTTEDYTTSMPLAFVEYDGELFRVLDYNDTFVESLQSLGIADVEMATCLINDTSRLPARTSRRLIESIKTARFSRQDYMTGGQTCVMRAKYLASNGARTSVLVSIESAASRAEQKRRERMGDAFEALYSIYEHVDILHLDEGYSEPVFSQASFTEVYDVPDIHDAIRQFSKNELYPTDRPRYLDFMNPDTMAQRIEESGQGFIVGFFRVRDRGGDYNWKVFAVIDLPDHPDKSVLVCVRDTNWENDALFQAVYEQGEDPPAHLDAADLSITDGSLWRAFSRSNQFCMFWKNLDRQFVGCNQGFLDYFGFKSVDSILGKTDEDMGWHVNAVPSKHEELRVLAEGASVTNEVVECIVRGRPQTIVASKWPIYRNGRIVGLVGFFIGEKDLHAEDDFLKHASVTDAVTGLLNYGGLDAATERYVEAYKKSGADFVMLAMDIENFEAYNDRYGYEFGDDILRCVADTVSETVPPDCVLGHIYADRYVVLRQNCSTEEMEALGQEIVSAIRRISKVKDTPCTLYARFVTVRFTDAGTFDELKRMGRERLQEMRRRS